MRDHNIIKNYKREINLQTKSIPSKKKYNRKEKHKNKAKDGTSSSRRIYSIFN